MKHSTYLIIIVKEDGKSLKFKGIPRWLKAKML